MTVQFRGVQNPILNTPNYGNYVAYGLGVDTNATPSTNQVQNIASANSYTASSVPPSNCGANLNVVG